MTDDLHDGSTFVRPEGVHGPIGLPDSDEQGPVAEAEIIAAEISTEANPRGELGRRFNWHSAFFVGMMGAAGVAVTYGLTQLFLDAGQVFILIGLALFLAIGLEPGASWLVRRKVPRGLAVTIVLLVIFGVIAGFLAAAVPAIVTQVTQLIDNIPKYVQDLKDHNSYLGKLNDRYHIQTKITDLLSSSGSGVLSGLLGAGLAIFGAVTDTLVVLVLTAYFLADMPRIRSTFYRLMPRSRRPRAILIGDDILSKVGVYVLGNLFISLIAGALTFGWLLIFGVPYPLLLSIMVALFDLVPVIGSTIAGVVVALVTLTVSFPLALATVAFFIVYRLAEDYFLVPRIIGRAVDVPALVTVVAVLIGGSLLGILGALVAIPIAAAIILILREVLMPRLDQA